MTILIKKVKVKITDFIFMDMLSTYGFFVCLFPYVFFQCGKFFVCILEK